MRNPFTRCPTQPGAELCHLRQQVATLQGELRQAHATIAALQRDNALLRYQRDEAQKGYEFYYDEYCRNYAAGGKHAMSDAMHATYANNDALAAECERLRTALAAATARAEAAEAKLALADEYGRCCAHDASFGNESPSFAAWLALREERRKREVRP